MTAPKQSATFTSLRTGQFPHHPHAQKVPNPEVAPNFGDDGMTTGAPSLPPLTRDNLPDSMLFPGMMDEDWSTPEETAAPPPEMQEEEDPQAVPSSATVDERMSGRNEKLANSPYAPIPPFEPKDREGNPVTPNSLSGQLAQFPQNNPPKWWQRAIAAGVGAGEGVANAGGHMRHPIDIGASVNAINHPGYQDKLEAWRSRVVPQELQLQLASQMRQAQIAQQKAQNEGQYKQAQAQQAAAQAKRYEALAGHYAAMDANASVVADPNLVKASGGAITLGQKVPTAVARDVYKAAATAAAKNSVLAPGAQLADPTGKILANNTNPRGAPPRPIVTNPQQIVFDPVTGKEIARNTNNRQFAPRAAGRGGANPQQAFTDIENLHQQSLANAEQQFLQDRDETKLAANKQKAENAYRAAIIRHHGTVAPRSPAAAGARPPLSAFER